METKTLRLMPTYPEVCDGCTEILPVPPRVMVVEGRLVRKHFFLCSALTMDHAAKAITNNSCSSKSIVPKRS